MADFKGVTAGGDGNPRACSRTFELSRVGIVALAGLSRRACVPQTAGGLGGRLSPDLRVELCSTLSGLWSIYSMVGPSTSPNEAHLSSSLWPKSR